MASISILLFGPARVVVGPEAQVMKIGRSALSLLVYLAVSANRPVSREAVAAELWPDCEQDRGRSRLSTAIWRLRKALGAAGAEDTLVAGKDGCLSLCEDLHASVDTNRFQAQADTYLEAPATAQCPLGGQMDLTGEPLSGWYDVWALSARVRIEDLYERCLSARLHQQAEAGLDTEAVATAEALLALDPLREDVHQLLMQLHMDHGRPGQAERQYLRCRDALAEDLGIQPTLKTQSLRPARVEAPTAPMRHDPVGERAVLSDLRKALHETQRNLAQVSNRLDVLLFR